MCSQVNAVQTWRNVIFRARASVCVKLVQVQLPLTLALPIVVVFRRHQNLLPLQKKALESYDMVIASTMLTVDGMGMAETLRMSRSCF